MAAAPPLAAEFRSDADLLAAASGGDRAALGELFDRHAGWVRAAAARRTGDRHAAEDVTQAVFLVLARRAGSVRGPALGAWLHRTTRYAAANARRADRRRRRRERAAARPEAAPVAEPADPLLAVLDEAIDALGPADRVAVVERYLRGRDLTAVAAALGTSPEAARKRVDRALGKLRGHLAQRRRTDAGLPSVVAALTAAGRVPSRPAAVPASASAAAIARGVITMQTWKKLSAAVLAVAVAAVAVGGGAVGAGLAVAAPATAPAPPALPADRTPLTAGDLVSVRLRGLIHPGTDIEVQAHVTDGGVPLPMLVGDVRLAGQDVAAAERTIDRRYADSFIVRAAQARVTVLKRGSAVRPIAAGDRLRVRVWPAVPRPPGQPTETSAEPVVAADGTVACPGLTGRLPVAGTTESQAVRGLASRYQADGVKIVAAAVCRLDPSTPPDRGR